MPSAPSVQIKEHLRTLLQEAGVVEPFHPGVRRELDVDRFLSERGCALIDTVEVPLDGGMPVGDFLGKIEAGEFSYTWSAPTSVKDRCAAALRSSNTSWKVFAATGQ